MCEVGVSGVVCCGLMLTVIVACVGKGKDDDRRSCMYITRISCHRLVSDVGFEREIRLK